MATRPNPMQTRQLDRTELRREQKLMLPADVILDPEEWDELLDFSNQSARQILLRKALIAARRAGLHPPRMLTEQERLALGLFILGEGPRPRFARFVSRDGHHGSSYLAADDPDAPKPAAPGPVEDPSEPGRYVQAVGRFARSDESGFTADPR